MQRASTLVSSSRVEEGSNPSIERTPSSQLRWLTVAAHVNR